MLRSRQGVLPGHAGGRVAGGAGGGFPPGNRPHCARGGRAVVGLVSIAISAAFRSSKTN